MNAKKTYFVMLGVAALLTLGIFAALFLSVSVLKSKSNDLVAVKLENKVLDEQQTSMIAAKAAIEKYKDLGAIAQAVVPHDKDQAQTVRSLSAIASGLDIKLSAINFPPSTLGQSTKSKKKTTETQVSPVPGIKNIYEIPITVQSDTTAPITYPKFIEFLTKLESNRRTAQVNTISIQPDAKNRNLLTFNLGLSTYIKP